jgi:CheY-like chemotaxis protein
MTRPTILVVDDEPAIAEMLQDLLEYEGYQVITAGDGREGLVCVATVRLQLVLSDVMMPGLDGRAFCRALQADPDTRSIPVVLMSAAAAPEALDGCRYAAFVRKPFDLTALVDLISAVLTGAPAG